MTDSKHGDDPENKNASEELREGLMHLFTAARKVIKSAEPTVSRSLDDAERVIGKIGRGGEVVAAEVGKEVAKLATGLADKLRAVANRVESNEAGDHDRDQHGGTSNTDRPPRSDEH